MAGWSLAPCLNVLNQELNEIAPSRDHTSDGTIGDEAHQGTNSDHNPDKNGYVCATDRDKDLNASFTMEDVVQYLLGECRKPNNVGKDYGRLNYIIYNRRIWRADTGWKQETYTGESPHTEHAHVSCEHDLNYVRDTRSFGLVEKFGVDEMDQDTFNTRMDTYLARISKQGSTAPNNQWETSPLARLVTDHQDMPAPLVGKDSTGKVIHTNLWQILEAIQKNLIIKDNTDEDILEVLTHIGNSIEQLKGLIEAHISGIVEGTSK